jgi:hypothetical protein
MRGATVLTTASPLTRLPVTVVQLSVTALPATGQPGRHVIEVVRSDFTFPYRNMQQSPAPDRPQFKVGFTISKGPAVLPAPPPQQAQAAL